MDLFCPACDRNVSPLDALDPRCPQCMRRLDKSLGPQDARSPRRPMVRTVALVLVAALGLSGVGGVVVLLRGGPTAPGPDSSTLPTAVSDTPGARLAAAGLTGAGAELPGTPGPALITAARLAKDTPATLAACAALVGPGKLQPVSPWKRRKAAVVSTARLFDDIQAGKAEPVHPIEAAFLCRALLTARGERAEIVREGAGLQTPVMLGRSRFGVRAGAHIAEPFATIATPPAGPMTQPVGVSDSEAIATWLVVRGQAARLRGDHAAARLDFAAADALVPGFAPALFGTGAADIDQGMHDKGIAACDEALRRQDDPIAQLYLVEVTSSLDRAVPAMQRAAAVLKKWPTLPEAMVAKGVLLAQRVQTLPAAQKAAAVAEAKALLDKAVAADPKVPGARAAVGQLHLLNQDVAAAIASLRQAVDQHKDPDAALILAEILRQGGKAAEAVPVLQAANRGFDDERFVLALVTALMESKQEEKALTLAEEAHTADPTSPQLGLLRADLLRRLGKVPEAISALEGLKGGANGDRIALLQAQLMVQAGKARDALGQIDAVVAKNKADREAQMLRLVALAAAGQGDAAVKDGQLLIADAVLKPIEVAGAFLQMGDAARAQIVLEAALPKDGTADKPDPDVVGMLAMVHVASGRKEVAVALRDKMVARAGADAETLKQAIDKAIDTASKELERMQAEQKAAPAAAP
ncbi:MAG: tetratricopeptide repeat protein [Myxococcales bacterium]|nr:tetratricopeptide repeat protein [Myxococcales bacterium]